MRVGLFVAGPGLGSSAPWQEMVARFAVAEDAGYSSAWCAQLFGPDPLLLAGAGLAATRCIEIGSAVVTTRTRHPIVLAQEARTLADAGNGRFTLGLGLGHAPVLRRTFGIPWTRPLQHLGEYLDALEPMLRGEPAHTHGEEYAVDAALDLPNAPAPPGLLLAALGPNMLDVAGRRSDGTITWMGGVRYLESTAVPMITAAARAAGRPPPRIVAGFPIAVTNRPDEARAQASDELRIYGRMPSYKAVLEVEGATDVTDVCVIGDEAAVARTINRISDAGVSDLLVAPLRVPGDDGSQDRTLALLPELGTEDDR